jgi:hypothetical protein
MLLTPAEWRLTIQPSNRPFIKICLNKCP